MAAKFTVFVLLYGNHPDLAERCLSSIFTGLDTSLVGSVRIGMNDVSDATKEVVARHVGTSPVPALIYNPGKNVLKYPLMRKMFYDSEHPIDTEYIMWFDDDSCIRTESFEWWRTVDRVMATADMLGDLFTMRFQGAQQSRIKNQKWYAGKPWAHVKGRGEVMKFATGGWWTIRTDIVKKWEYPWQALRHNGGDSTLGEMMRQQGYRVRSFKQDLWINADESGRPSKAGRRGVDEGKRPVWSKAEMTSQDYAHNNFQVCAAVVGVDTDPLSPRNVTIPPLAEPEPLEDDDVIRIPGL